MNTETKAAPIRSPSPSAKRMRLYRRRRQRGLRPFQIQLGRMDIEALIAKGYLDSNDREDSFAIAQAADAFITDALVTS